MNKKDIIERMLVTGCSMAQIEFVTGLKLVIIDRKTGNGCRVIGIKIPGHWDCYAKVSVPINNINNFDF